MSIYKQLNDMQLDLSKYEEETLTELEQKKWEKRVIKKIQGRKKSTKKWVAASASFVLAIGLMIPYGQVTLAETIMTGIIEQFIHSKKPLDSYKTAIGETAENTQGKMTLNEVLIDADSLLISSTFDPAKGLSFSNLSALFPRVLVNGQDIVVTRGNQTVATGDGKYTIYGEIKFTELPSEGPLQIKITYDEIHQPFNKKSIVIDEPWVFDVTVSTDQINKDTQIIQLDKTITLINGKEIKLNNLTVSPVSTVLSYNLTEGTERTYFKLVSSSGDEVNSRVRFAYEVKETAYNRYEPIDLQKEKYSLIPVNGDGQEIGSPIQIN